MFEAPGPDIYGNQERFFTGVHRGTPPSQFFCPHKIRYSRLAAFPCHAPKLESARVMGWRSGTDLRRPDGALCPVTHAGNANTFQAIGERVALTNELLVGDRVGFFADCVTLSFCQLSCNFIGIYPERLQLCGLTIPPFPAKPDANANAVQEVLFDRQHCDPRKQFR